jgi:putative phage-type endonuclease
MNSSFIRHSVVQGSEEWQALRISTLNASEAPVMMGSHPNMSREELLRAKVTKEPKEFSRYVTEKIFPEGHRVEQIAIKILSDELDEELFPVTCQSGMMLASFDGLSMDAKIAAECKQHNEKLVAALKAHKKGEGEIPDYIRWQLDHQFAANPKLEVIYWIVSDGTKRNTIWTKYTTTPERQKLLYAGWDQFLADMKTWTPPVDKVEPVGVRPETMPALLIDLDGQLTTTGNLEEFQSKAFMLIDGLKKELQSDQDFADADVSVKWLDDVEKNIKAEKARLLEKTASLADLFRTLDTITERARKARLALSNQVSDQKKKRRDEIVTAAESEVKAHMFSLNKLFLDEKITVPEPAYNMWDVIHGKRSLKLMRDAVKTEIASIKMKATMKAEAITKSLEIIRKEGDGYSFLFENLKDLVELQPDHLTLHIKNKIQQYLDDQDVAEQNRVAAHKLELDKIRAATALVSSDMTLQQLRILRDQNKLRPIKKLEEFESEGILLMQTLMESIDAAEKEVIAAERAKIMQPLEYGGKFIVQIATDAYRVKASLSDAHALHQDSFKSVDEAKGWCDLATTVDPVKNEPLEMVVDALDDLPDVLDGEALPFLVEDPTPAELVAAFVKISRRGNIAFFHGVVNQNGQDIPHQELPAPGGFLYVALN